jgi:hypothetical protein
MTPEKEPRPTTEESTTEEPTTEEMIMGKSKDKNPISKETQEALFKTAFSLIGTKKNNDQNKKNLEKDKLERARRD